jgi:hypothetical protein
MRADMAVRDSLSRVHPRMRASWLRERGLDESPYTTFRKPDSGSGLHEIGRWPWGPSWELCGRDSLLFLGSGSGVRILSISDSVHPLMLGQVAARGLVSQLVIRDTLLFVACGTWGAQIYSVNDPANPQELGSMDAVIGDLSVQDTLCYALGGDSLRIFNVANPASPLRLSARSDSSELMAVTNGYAFCGNQFTMNVYDVRVPTVITWVGSRSGNYLSLAARGNLLFQGSYDPVFWAILDVSTPTAITELSRVSDVSAYGMHAPDSFAYLAWGGLHIVNIADTMHPSLVGTSTHYDEEEEPFVVAAHTYAYLADRYGGLKVIDIRNPAAPRETTTCFVAGGAYDISISGDVGVVAGSLSGLNTIGLSDPARPLDLGWLGPLSGTDQIVHAAEARDSFALCGWSSHPQHVKTVSIADPTQPTPAGGCNAWEEPQDIALRDSLAYCAENYKFQVVNAARPRQPQVVGTCNLQNYVYTVSLEGNYAYVTDYPAAKIDVSDPTHPTVVEQIPCNAWSMVVRDTLAFFGGGSDGLRIWNVANLGAAHEVSSLILPQQAFAVAVTDSLVYVGGPSAVFVVDIADPLQPRLVGSVSAPYYVWRLEYQSPYLYAACEDAGVVIYESLPVGIAEERPAAERRAAVGMRGSVVRDELVLELPAAGGGDVMLSAYDMSGRCVEARVLSAQGRQVKYSLARLPAGVYVLRVRCAGQTQSFKVVKL